MLPFFYICFIACMRAHNLFFGHTAQLVGYQSRNQELNPDSRQWRESYPLDHQGIPHTVLLYTHTASTILSLSLNPLKILKTRILSNITFPVEKSTLAQRHPLTFAPLTLHQLSPLSPSPSWSGSNLGRHFAFGCRVSPFSSNCNIFSFSHLSCLSLTAVFVCFLKSVDLSFFIGYPQLEADCCFLSMRLRPCLLDRNRTETRFIT